jgi:hypothetical protein
MPYSKDIICTRHVSTILGLWAFINQLIGYIKDIVYKFSSFSFWSKFLVSMLISTLFSLHLAYDIYD